MGLQTLRRTGGPNSPWHVTAAENARLVRQVVDEIWNAGDFDLADRLFSPAYVNHGGLIPDLVRGPEAIKISVALYRAAFPRFRIVVIDLLAQGQTVALRWTAHGTPHCDGVGDQTAGTSDTLRGMTFGRLAGGQIVESWTCWEADDAGEPEFVQGIRAMAHEGMLTWDRYQPRGNAGRGTSRSLRKEWIVT